MYKRMVDKRVSVQYTGSKPSPFLVKHHNMMDDEYPILDIGCGNMRNTKWLRSKGYLVFPIDMIRPQCYGSDSVVLKTLPRDSLPTGYYDGFLLNYVLMFMSNKERTRICKQIDSRARPSAIVFIEMYESVSGKSYDLKKIIGEYIDRGWWVVRKQNNRCILRKGR